MLICVALYAFNAVLPINGPHAARSRTEFTRGVALFKKCNNNNNKQAHLCSTEENLYGNSHNSQSTEKVDLDLIN